MTSVVAQTSSCSPWFSDIRINPYTSQTLKHELFNRIITSNDPAHGWDITRMTIKALKK